MGLSEYLFFDPNTLRIPSEFLPNTLYTSPRPPARPPVHCRTHRPPQESPPPPNVKLDFDPV